jgi:hypothetical protein
VIGISIALYGASQYAMHKPRAQRKEPTMLVCAPASFWDSFTFPWAIGDFPFPGLVWLSDFCCVSSAAGAGELDMIGDWTLECNEVGIRSDI